MWARLSILALLALSPFQTTVPVPFGWTNHPSHDGATWEVERNGQVVPCGSVTVVGSERRCTAQLPLGTATFRLRGTRIIDGKPEVGNWSQPITDTIALPGPFTITFHEEGPDVATQSVTATFEWASTATAGTTIDVTLGFQPTFVIVWHSTNTSATDAIQRSSALTSMGFGVSDSDRRVAAFASADAAGTADIGVYHSNAAICRIGAGSDLGTLDLASRASWPSDGVRFVVDTQAVASLRINVLAIGGDVNAAATFQFQEPGATGAQSVAHGLGSTPTGVLFASVGFGTAPASSSTTQGMLMIGASDGTRSWVNLVGGDDGNTTMDTRGYGLSGEAIALSPEPATSINARASVTSLDGTNVNLNWTERAATRYVFGIVFSGGQFRVDETTTATNTSAFNGPAMGFVARGALFASTGRAESTADTPTDHARLSVGFASSASDRRAQAFLDEDGVGTSEVTTAIEYDAVYINISTASAVQGLMDIADMSVDPMSLIMDDADPSGSWVGIAAWGDTPAAPGGNRRRRLLLGAR